MESDARVYRYRLDHPHARMAHRLSSISSAAQTFCPDEPTTVGRRVVDYLKDLHLSPTRATATILTVARFPPREIPPKPNAVKGPPCHGGVCGIVLFAHRSRTR